jgi:hypothetical protein
MLIFVAWAEMTGSVSCKCLYSDCLKNEQHKTQVWVLLLEGGLFLVVQKWRILLWHSDLSWRRQLYWWQSGSSWRFRARERPVHGHESFWYWVCRTTLWLYEVSTHLSTVVIIDVPICVCRKPYQTTQAHGGNAWPMCERVNLTMVS